MVAFAQGPSSKNRSRSQAGTSFPSTYLARMNQALGTQRNPLSVIGNRGAKPGGLFARSPARTGYEQTGMFNFGLNMAVTSPEYIRRNFPDQTQRGRFNPYTPLSFERPAVAIQPGPDDPYDPNNPRWRDWIGTNEAGWDLSSQLMGAYQDQAIGQGLVWAPSDPSNPDDNEGQWVNWSGVAGAGGGDPHLFAANNKQYLYGSEISREQWDYLNTGSPNTGDHPNVAPGTAFLMQNSEGWGMPSDLWGMYKDETAWGLSWINGAWVPTGGRNLTQAQKDEIAAGPHGPISAARQNITPDLTYWGTNNKFYFRGWEMDQTQVDVLQQGDTAGFFASAYDVEADGEQNLPGVTNSQGDRQNTIYCFLGACYDADQNTLTAPEVATRESAGAMVHRDNAIAAGSVFPETGGGTSPFAANRVPIDEYYVDPSFMADAFLKLDADKGGDFFRLFYDSGGIFERLGKTPGNITLADLWTVYSQADSFGLSGRSKGNLFLMIGDIHGQKLLEEQQGPEGIFGSQDPGDAFIDPSPGSGFSERVPSWIKDQYRDGSARGWSWDGSQWLPGTTDPELVWDANVYIADDGPHKKGDPVMHEIYTIDENNQPITKQVQGTGRLFYRGQQISQVQWENMQIFGPLSGLSQTSPELSTAFETGTAEGLSWKNGKWEPDVGRPDLVWDAANDTPYFRGQLITPAQYLQIVREGPGVMGTTATAQHLLSQVSSGAGAAGRISDADLAKFENWAQVNDINPADLPAIRDQFIQAATADAALIADSPNFRFDPTLVNQQFGYDAAQIGRDNFNFDASSYDAPLITETNEFLNPSIYQSLTAAPTEEFERRHDLKTGTEYARLAAMGLAGSGAGHGQLMRALEPLERQQQALLFGAAGKATEMSKDYALQIAMANQKSQQEALSQAAGFRQDARKFGAQTEFDIATMNQKALQEALQFTGQAEVQIALANQKFENDADRYGVEVAFNLQVANQKTTQEANLVNAGFDQEAALQQAANFLQGDMTRFDNMVKIAQGTQDAKVRADVANMQSYANALGLNVQSLFKERDNFLQALGLMQRDVQMESESERAFLALAFGEWQSQRNAIGNAGRFSTAMQRSSTDGGFNLDLSIPMPSIPSVPGAGG